MKLALAILGAALLLLPSVAAQAAPPPPLIGDFDGDGRPDLATWNDTDKKWSILLNCGQGFQRAVEWDGMWGTDGKAYVADLNGDKKADILMWNDASKQWSVNISTGSGFKPARWSGMWGTDGAIHLADLNGDGKTDILMWYDAGKQWSVNISTGNGFKPARWDGALWGTDGEIHIADVNGDKKADVVMWYDAGKQWSVDISTGKGFKPQRWDGALWGTDGEIHVADVNGDGKDDIVMWYDAGKQWSVDLSTGKSFNPVRWSGAWGSDGPISIGDLNGDGKDDIFMWRAADGVWTVNLSTGKGFAADIWKAPGSSRGTFFVADFNKDKKADVLIWQAGQTPWITNLSTGKGWTAAQWEQAPRVPTIANLSVDPKPLNKGDPVIIDYAVNVFDDCKPNITIYQTDDNGGAIGTIYQGANASGSISLGDGYTYPMNLMLVASCDNGGCGGASRSGLLKVAGPPVLKITSFTASGGGFSASAFNPGDLYVPVGTPITLAWSVADCGAGCNVAVQGMRGNSSSAVSIFVKQGLPTSGSLQIPVTDTQTTWYLAASDTGDSIKSAHIEIDLAPLNPADPCAGGKCQWFYFKLTSPPSSSSPECFTTEVYAPDLATARQRAQAQATNYTLTQITADQYLQGCN